MPESVDTGLRPIPWAEFRDEVLRLYQPPMRRRTTRDKTRQVLEEFRPLCATTGDLSELTIADWLALHPHRAAATIESLLRHLSAVCTYGAHLRRRYLWDPFEDRPVSSWLPADELDEAEPWKRHRTAEEIRSVLARADLEALDGPREARRLRADIWTLAYTGAHKTEVLGLRLVDLDPVHATIAFRSHRKRRLKTASRSAVLPLAEPLAPVLARWQARVLERFPTTEYLFPHAYGDGPWISGRPGHRPLDQVRALGERAGVPGLTLAAFRHTLATLAESEEWDFSELALQRILRHARRNTQRSYRHPDMRLMRESLGRVHY